MGSSRSGSFKANQGSGSGFLLYPILFQLRFDVYGNWVFSVQPRMEFFDYWRS